MKRLFRVVPALAAALAAVSARADVVYYELEGQGEIKSSSPLDVLLDYLPLILIVALLIVTALLVRHFTRKGKK